MGGPDGAQFDMLYVYVVDGRIVNQVTQIRTQMLWSALLGRKNTPVHFLRFIGLSASDASSPTSAQEHARLKRFAGQMWKSLEPKIVSRDHS